MLITPIERENVQLFAELLTHMHRESEELEDPQFLQLAQSMAALRDRLQTAIANVSFAADIPRVIATLDAALLRYEDLATGGVERIEYKVDLAGPTRPRSHTGSIVNVESAKAGNTERKASADRQSENAYRPQLPPSAEVIPVLRPANATNRDGTRGSDELIPNIYAADEVEAPKREDPLAELADDVPLIQL